MKERDMYPDKFIQSNMRGELSCPTILEATDPNIELLNRAKELTRNYANKNPESAKLILKIEEMKVYIIGGVAKRSNIKEDDIDILFNGTSEFSKEVFELIDFVNEDGVHAQTIELDRRALNIEITDHFRNWLLFGQVEENHE